MIPINCICSNCNIGFFKKDIRNMSTALNLFCSKICYFDFLRKNKKLNEVQCDTCKKIVVKKQSEYKKYKLHFCSKECLSKRNLEKNVLKCEVCLTDVYRPLSKRKKTTRVFCSKKCEGIGKDTRINTTCPFCKVRFKQKSQGQKFCSNQCKFDSSKNKIEVSCFYCQKKTSKTPYQIKLAEHIFCGNSCKGKYYSWKNEGRRRSSSEIKLCEIIKQDFPNIEVLENTRDVLNCHLEIDIWIPSINLAIELNGPCHFINIYGDKIYQKTLTNDETKKKEILERGFNLLIININQPEKIVNSLLLEQFNSVIKPLLLTVK